MKRERERERVRVRERERERGERERERKDIKICKIAFTRKPKTSDFFLSACFRQSFASSKIIS